MGASASEVDAEAYDEMGFINMVEKMNKSPPNEKLKETLLGFGTWDTIYMNGGQTIIGDILEYPYEKKNCSIDHWNSWIDYRPKKHS